MRLVRALRAELGTDHGTVRRVADQLGFGVESVRKWVRQADIDDGDAAGTTTADRGRIWELESGEPRAAPRERDLEIGVGFLRGGARRPTGVMVSFIDENREDFGVEPICAQLPIAPSGYYGAKSRPPSARARRDGVLVPQLVALWRANYRVYGAHKLWRAARRAGIDVGRDQVARLMRLAGIEGIRRRRVRTTRPDSGAVRPADLVERDFSATEPNRLWVTDLTYVATWAGVAYVCFIVDAYSRMIVGWRVAAHMRTSMVLDALEMARASRATRLAGLVAHSDAGSQFTSLRWGERLAELGAVPSVGSVGDSYDCDVMAGLPGRV